jgi:NarL family two-component system sensor histidine kinase YdfH
MDVSATVSDQLALQIEKIISEGLTNIVRHAQAKHSWIHLASNADKIRLEIGDDGLGFDVDAYQIESGHYGLVGIRERVRLAGGVLKVESHPDGGTLLTITFPSASRGEKKP